MELVYMDQGIISARSSWRCEDSLPGVVLDIFELKIFSTFPGINYQLRDARKFK